MKKELLAAALLFIVFTSCTPDQTNLTEIESTLTPTATGTPEITVTPTTIPSPTPTPTGGSSGLLFYSGSFSESNEFTTNFYNYNFSTQKFTLLPEFTDQDLLAVSPDGQKILTNKVTRFKDNKTQAQMTLMVSNIDGSNPVILAERLFDQNKFNNREAFWLSYSDSILYFDDDNGQIQVFMINSDGSNNQQITHAPSGVPFFIPVLVNNGLYFSDAIGNMYWTSLTTGEIKQLEYIDLLSGSPDGKYLIWRDGESQDSKLHIFQVNSEQEVVVSIDHSMWIDSVYWLPNNQEFIATTFSDGGEIQKNLLMNCKGEVVKEIDWDKMISIFSWSPDGNQFTFTDETSSIWVMDLPTMNYQEIVPYTKDDIFYYSALWLK